LRLQR